MLLLRISLIFLTLSTALNVTVCSPLSKTSQRHIIPGAAGEKPRPSPEVLISKPNSLIHNVPNEFFLTPAPSDPPDLELQEKEEFGLWPSGHTVPVKTILLSRGEAKFDATFQLILREGEDLKGMHHRPNDTSIITSFEESRERHVGHIVTYNFTITHFFKGTVGSAEYEVTILTTSGATLRARGTYYVSGVVIYASTDHEPLRIVSGITATPLAVKSLYSFSHMMKDGHIRFPLKLQQVGPDITGKRMPLPDVLSTANISVMNMPSDNLPVLIKNVHKCSMMDKKISLRQKGSSNRDYCDVGFDYHSMSLILRFRPERYGKAVIELAFPTLRIDREAFKTEIKLEVFEPAIRIPELFMEKDIHLQLDYHGTESFSLQMRNMNASDHRREVLSYVLDLPGNRYAIADFASSSLARPTQNISFTVIAPGQESRMLLEKIRHALMDNSNSSEGQNQKYADLVKLRRLENSANESHHLQSYRRHGRTSTTSFGLSSLALYNDEDYSEGFDIVSIRRTQERNYRYRSQVHAVIPNFDDLVTLPIPSNFVLRTSFASRRIAMIESLRVQIDHENILVKLFLLQYTLSTFSQHKSLQIAKSLSNEISSLLRVSILPATLVMIQDRGLNIEAAYHILVPGKYIDAVMDLHKYKKNISSSITSTTFLKDGRIMISEIVRLTVLGRPTNGNIMATEEPPRYTGVNGTLLAVIVIISLITVIPLLIACIGYLLIQWSRGEHSSSFDSDSIREPPEREGKAKQSREDLQAAPDVLRDNYGRADEDSYESFKVRTELSQQGYFGDKVSSRKKKSKPLAPS